MFIGEPVFMTDILTVEQCSFIQIDFLFVIYYKSHDSVQGDKYNLKNRKNVTRKIDNIILAQEEMISSLLFWISFN